MTEYPVVLTQEEAAEIARVSIWTLARWRRLDPTFPARQFGQGVIRIPRDAFVEWLTGADLDALNSGGRIG